MPGEGTGSGEVAGSVPDSGKWIARQHKSGNLREEEMSLTRDQVLEVARSKGQLGSEFMDHQRYRNTRIRSFQRCLLHARISQEGYQPLLFGVGQEQVTNLLQRPALAGTVMSEIENKSFEELQMDISACISVHRMSEWSGRQLYSRALIYTGLQ